MEFTEMSLLEKKKKNLQMFSLVYWLAHSTEQTLGGDISVGKTVLFHSQSCKELLRSEILPESRSTG